MGQIILKSIGNNKLSVIQTIRRFTGVGLAEAKSIAESVGVGSFVGILSVPPEETDNVISAFTSAGADVREGNGNVSCAKTVEYNVTAASTLRTEAPASTVVSASRYKAKPVEISVKTDGTLKGYLKTASALECQAWTQERLIERLNRKRNSLGKYRNIVEPEKPIFSDALVGLNQNYFTISFVAIGIAILLVFPFVVGFVGALALFLACFAVALIPGFLDYSGSMKRYVREMEKYRNALAADAKRVNHELQAKEELDLQIIRVREERERTEKALRSLYGVGVLHASYRNMVAVCSLYDYISKGICFQLTGGDGAYAFYERDLHFKRIETQLDVIIDKLDVIIANQEQIANLIQQGNAALYRIEQQNRYMTSTLDRISENTALTEYNTRCAAESLSVLESIEIYRVLKYD